MKYFDFLFYADKQILYLNYCVILQIWLAKHANTHIPYTVQFP